jgi:hypothetical protein
MADSAIDTYLNDHLAGAMFGRDLADQVRDRADGTPLGDAMRSLAQEIDEDRQALIDLMERLGTSKNPVKQVTAWLAEKASRAKFGGPTGGETELGLFMSLEALAIGVEGKRCLWSALREVVAEYPELNLTELDRLADRARSQRRALERERIEAARRALPG